MARVVLVLDSSREIALALLAATLIAEARLRRRRLGGALTISLLLHRRWISIFTEPRRFQLVLRRYGVIAIIILASTPLNVLSRFTPLPFLTFFLQLLVLFLNLSNVIRLHRRSLLFCQSITIDFRTELASVASTFIRLISLTDGGYLEFANHVIHSMGKRLSQVVETGLNLGQSLLIDANSKALLRMNLLVLLTFLLALAYARAPWLRF